MVSAKPGRELKTARRTRWSVDARRQHLLASGLEAFATVPYSEISTADLARRAGVSQALLFHYFETKRGYYLEVLRAVMDRLVAATAGDPAASPDARLRAGVRAQVDFAERYPAAYSLVIGGGWSADAEVRAIYEAARAEAAANLFAALAVGDPPPKLAIAVRGWQGFVEAAIADWLERQGVGKEELVELLAAALGPALALGGLQAGAVSARSADGR